MIVGNGLLASAFSKSNLNFDKFVIFASGVSNSKETDPLQFHREFNLLESVIRNIGDKILIYFSTCSISENTPKPYTLHKLSIEDYIKKNVDKFLILRLPNIVGVTRNPYQLTNFIYNKISDNSEFIVYKNVQRNLIDVDDIPTITKHIIECNIFNTHLDILFNNKISMIDLIKIFENVLNKTANIKYEISDTLNYIVDNTFFISLISNFPNNRYFNTVTEDIIYKYYKYRSQL
jgi:nucleoside-diphosphate-sugar epimerase